VPFEASIAMSEALNSKLVQNKLIVLPNLDHDLFEQIDNPAVAKAWTAALDFLAD